MDITSEIGTPAVLEQTAEECVELAEAITSLLRLAHACQKEARRLRGECVGMPGSAQRGRLPHRHGGCKGQNRAVGKPH